MLDRKEMVNSYEPPADAVEGWTGGNEPTATFVTPEVPKVEDPVLPSEEPTLAEGDIENELPF